MKDKMKLIAEPKLKGKVKIEKFEDGILHDTIEKHNFINPRANAVYDMLARHYMFGQGFLPVNNAEHQQNNLLFRTLMLTDNVKSTDPGNETYVDGKLIGYAQTEVTYVGSDSLLGTINTAETFINNERAKLVFDFPTSAGNGTFQSIYLTPFPGSVFDLLAGLRVQIPLDVKANLGGAGTIDHSRYAYDHFSGDIYINRSPNLHRLRIFYDVSTGNFSFAGEIVRTVALLSSRNNSGFWFTQNDLMWATTDHKVYKVPKSDLTGSPVLVATMPTAITSSGYSAYTVGYDHSENQIVFMRTDDKVLIRFDLELNEINRTPTSFPVGWNFPLQFSHDGTKLFKMNNPYSSGYISYYMDLTDKEVKLFRTSSSYGSFGSGGDSRYGVLFDYSDEFFLRVNPSYIELVPKVFFGSRVLLETPVTKTNAETMKITYELEFPPYPLTRYVSPSV
ncbi:hypothetical protein [Paenisporosarcina sp. TG-14]|uniref:hypothetical protein n=1 Tax=Paenisporosarcina sp. TG-14 TaxID=1231057 RepID=UPI00030AB7A7|nr:hypothetical protein [Paenisporosarcina sp. TG-14]